MFYKLNYKDDMFSYFLKCSKTRYLCLKNDFEEDLFIVGNTYELDTAILSSTIFDIDSSEISNDILNLIIKNTSIQSFFMDQIDGDIFANEFISSIVSIYKNETPFIDVEEHKLSLNNHIVDGKILTVWVGDRIVATANIMRTPNYNRTHVICNSLSEDF